MGQFDSYIERNPPPSPRAARVLAVAMPIVAIAYAIGSRDDNDIMLAALTTVIFLPAGIAPKAYRSGLAALARHPVPHTLVFFVFILAWLFVFLSTVVSHTTSLYIAAPAAVVLTVLAAIHRRSRLRASAGAEPS